MNTWYLVKCKFIKEFTDGTLKRVTDQYLINAVSFTEAEARAHKEIGEFIRGEFVVHSISKQDFADIFSYEDADVWHKCKLSFISENPDNGREMLIKENYLVEAPDVDQAYERLVDSMKGLMVTFKIPSIQETKIIDVFTYDPEFSDKVISESTAQSVKDVLDAYVCGGCGRTRKELADA
jgi:hypothetical protein